MFEKFKEFTGFGSEYSSEQAGGQGFGHHDEHLSAVPDNSLHTIATVVPHNLETDAPIIGDAFRSGRSTIMNLSELPTNEANRFVDFASGLVYGLEGKIEHIDAKIFILTPFNIHMENDTTVNASNGMLQVG